MLLFVIAVMLLILLIMIILHNNKDKKEQFYYWRTTPQYVTGDFTLKSALFMAQLSDMAYYTNTDQQIDVISNFMNSYGLKFNKMNIYTDVDTQTSFIYATDTKNKDIYISFRGTELDESNLKTDLYESMVPFPFTPTLKVGTSFGFTKAWTNLRNSFYDVIGALQPENIYITGHSLGGALASLAAFDYKYHTNGMTSAGSSPNGELIVYTFASPRVGDTGFAYHYDKMINKNYRVQNIFDPVPRFPTELQGYKHVKQEVLLNGLSCSINAKLPDNYPYDIKEHSLLVYIKLIRDLMDNKIRCVTSLIFPQIGTYCTEGNTIPPYGFKVCNY